MAGHSLGGAGPAIIGVAWMECAIALLALSLRCYSQATSLGRLGWDLLWASTAMILAITATVLITLSTTYGIGNHVDAVRPQDTAKGNELNWIAQVIGIMANAFGKSAVVALLLRIHGQTRRFHRIFLLYLIGSVFLINCIQIVLIFFQCTPIQGLWDKNVKADCHLLTPFLYTGTFQGSWASFTDFILALYPIYFFWDLRVDWKTKVGLICLFLGGTIAGIAAAIKTHNIVTLGSQEDETYATKNLLFWLTTETYLIIIMGSIPPLRPLVTKISRRVGTTINGSRDRSFGQSSTKSPKPTTKDSLTFRTLELGKIRQPFSSSSTDNQLDFHGESDGFAILDRSGGDNRLSDEEQAGIQITTDISVKSEQDEPVQGTFSRTESDGEIERGGPLG